MSEKKGEGPGINGKVKGNSTRPRTMGARMDELDSDLPTKAPGLGKKKKNESEAEKGRNYYEPLAMGPAHPTTVGQLGVS